MLDQLLDEIEHATPKQKARLETALFGAPLAMPRTVSAAIMSLYDQTGIVASVGQPVPDLTVVAEPVKIASDGRCTCTCADPCPLKKTGSAMRCTVQELTAAGIPVTGYAS